MGVDGAIAASELARSWELLADALDRGWRERRTGAIGVVTGIDVAMLNPVLVLDPQAEAGAVSELIERVASRGVPYCLQCRPAIRALLSPVAAVHGMKAGEDLPLMVLENAGATPLASVAGLSLRQLAPEENGVHAYVAAAGFEGPEQLFEELVPPSVLAARGVRCYVGEAEGEAVTTALSVTLQRSVGIFNVATPRERRGRGYGGAVTAHAVLDAARAGASWAWLQSSPPAVSVYEGLGFRTVESWPSWVSG